MSTGPCWIEIAGVAGSGKSTLTRALCDRYAECRVADSLHTRLPAHWPYVAHSIPGLLPLVARTARSRPALSWDELKFVIYVSEWSRFLRAEREYGSGVLLLDQGPIFALARLLWGQKPITRSAWARTWVNAMIERWSLELNALVWLDAPDDVLLGRINNREQRHEAKGRLASDGLELITAHRQAYEQLFEEIARLGRPPVLRFDTSATSAAAITRELERVFDALRPRRLTDVPLGLNVG